MPDFAATSANTTNTLCISTHLSTDPYMCVRAIHAVSNTHHKTTHACFRRKDDGDLLVSPASKDGKTSTGL